MNPVFTGKIERGKVVLDAVNRYLVHISKYEGKRIELVVRLQKSQRSLNQNSYMWGVVYEILSHHLGYTTDEVHEICKFKFLRTTISNDSGAYDIGGSTTKLNTAQMEEYLDKIRQWAEVMFELRIPLPNEVDII